MGNQVIDLTKVPLIRRSGTGVADRTSHGFLELPGLCITESLQVSLLLSWVRVSNFPHLGQQLLGELSKLAHSKPCSTCRTLAPSSRWLENVSEDKMDNMSTHETKEKFTPWTCYAIMLNRNLQEVFKTDIFAHHSARVLPMPELASQTPLQPSMDRKLPSSHCSPGCAWAQTWDTLQRGPELPDYHELIQNMCTYVL